MSLGGSGVSIKGVRILRVGSNKSTQALLVLEFGVAWWLNPVAC